MMFVSGARRDILCLDRQHPRFLLNHLKESKRTEGSREYKIFFTLYCQGAGVNYAMDDIFLLNEGPIIAVCWAQNLGTGNSFLLSVAPFHERASLALPGRAAALPPACRSCLLGFKFCSCQALENMFSSCKNVWSST